MRIRVSMTVGVPADEFSDRLFVAGVDVSLPRTGERPT